MSIKTPEQVLYIQDSCQILKEVFQVIDPYVQEGVSTEEIDRELENCILLRGGKPAFKHYRGFPKSCCISVNSAVIHGIPSSYRLQKGDVVSIDCGINYKGYYSDCARTYGIGVLTNREKDLIYFTEQALLEGIQAMLPGGSMQELSRAIFQCAKRNHLGIVKEYTGHGVGLAIHEDPPVPNFPFKGSSPLIHNGIVWAIEPMLTLGAGGVYVGPDGWTVFTEDDSKAAHFEHTVACIDDRIQILT